MQLKVGLRAVISAGLVFSLSACTTSQDALSKNPKSVSKAALCRSYVTTKDYAFQQQLQIELTRRSISSMQCVEIVRKQNNAIAAGVAIAAIGAAVAVCSNNNCGGGGYNRYSYDQGADWDAFYNQYGNVIWACRDIGTGRFTYDYNCAGKAKTDWRWPSKYSL